MVLGGHFPWQNACGSPRTRSYFSPSAATWLLDGRDVKAGVNRAVASPRHPTRRAELQPSAPFDLTFDGCQLYETVRHSAQKCLRFSTRFR